MKSLSLVAFTLFSLPLLAEHAALDASDRRPLNNEVFRVGCQDPNQKKHAELAKQAIEKTVAGLNKYGKISLDVGECDPYQVETLLGKPHPIFVRAPDPVCGVAVRFEGANPMRAFLRDTWTGKILADQVKDGRVRLTSSDDESIRDQASVAFCPEERKVPDCWSNPRNYFVGQYSLYFPPDDREAVMDRLKDSSLSPMGEPRDLQTMGKVFLGVKALAPANVRLPQAALRKGVEGKLTRLLEEVPGLTVTCSPVYRTQGQDNRRTLERGLGTR